MFHVFILTVIGVLMALAIGLVAKYFGAEQDPRADQLLELLPGANCGGCGFAGCADYVKAMLEGRAKPGCCPGMTPASLSKASCILGVEAEERERKVAVVCCRGDESVAVNRAFYNGVTDCVNAVMVANGGKACTFGCLGLGTCARVCPFGAIEITEKHLAVVHPELCRGCNKCVEVCPRHIIKLVPAKAPVHVLCSSPESFKIKKGVCSVACIGCRKCAKNAKEGQITFNGFLACINYANPPEAEVADVCPVHVIAASKAQQSN